MIIKCSFEESGNSFWNNILCCTCSEKNTTIKIEQTWKVIPVEKDSFHSVQGLKVLRHRSCFSKSSFPIRFNSRHRQPFFFLFCYRMTPLVFFFLSKPLFLGFPALTPQFRPSKKWLKISWRTPLIQTSNFQVGLFSDLSSTNTLPNKMPTEVDNGFPPTLRKAISSFSSAKLVD